MGLYFVEVFDSIRVNKNRTIKLGVTTEGVYWPTEITEWKEENLYPEVCKHVKGQRHKVGETFLFSYRIKLFILVYLTDEGEI